MAKQLAALVSSLQGIDMSPLQNARNTSIARGGLIENNRAAKAQEALEKQRLDLAGSNAADTLALDRERLGLSRAQLTVQEKQAEEQRALERELAASQQAHQIDLADMQANHELAVMKAQDAINDQNRADQEEYEAAKEQRLFALSGDALRRELALGAEEEQRQYDLNKSRGIDPGADAKIERSIKGIQKAIMQKQADLEAKKIDAETGTFEEQMKIEQDIKILQKQESLLKIKKIERELEETDPNNPMVQELRKLRLRAAEAETTTAEETAKQSQQTTEAQGIALEKAKKGQEGAEEGSGEYVAGTKLTQEETDFKARIADELESEDFYEWGSGREELLEVIDKLDEFRGSTDKKGAAKAEKAKKVIELYQEIEALREEAGDDPSQSQRNEITKKAREYGKLIQQVLD